MKSFRTISITVLLFLLSWGGWCNGEAEASAAPMEETEKKALYSTIQGFVGNWWNGSDLYPDPCGWTPIQVHVHIYKYILIMPFIYFSSLFFFQYALKYTDSLSA